MTAVAALESGQAPTRQGPSALMVAAYVAGAAVLAASVALLAGFVNLRDAAASWPPEHAEFDEYLSVMLTATLLLSGAVVAWASQASSAGNRRQVLAALALAGGLGAAFVNLAWYTGTHAGFGPSTHAFGAIVITSLVLCAVAVAVSIGFLAVALLRYELRAAEPSLVGAAARFYFLVVAAWLLSPVALYGLMSAK
ncbi:MAG TPA: cytochrome c oxidase subunit 3 [Acidimicrobiales bacterium]|nr:cytochrome c oxidase subunit 3 [Acidimicrobiales bacterium]